MASLDSSRLPASLSWRETLKRLITKIAMILQAGEGAFSSCTIRGLWSSLLTPAFGLTEEQLRTFRIPDARGISGAVFQTGQPLVVHDLASG